MQPKKPPQPKTGPEIRKDLIARRLITQEGADCPHPMSLRGYSHKHQGTVCGRCSHRLGESHES